MDYFISATISLSFEETLEKVTNELKKKGFGVITTIDVKDTLKIKIDVEFRKYTILGACNPEYAHNALLLDDKIGTLLPCNVILQEIPGGTEVAAINPYESMKGILQPDAVELTKEITRKLLRVIENL